MKKPNKTPINIESGDMLSFFVSINDSVELVSASTGNETNS